MENSINSFVSEILADGQKFLLLYNYEHSHLSLISQSMYSDPVETAVLKKDVGLIDNRKIKTATIKTTSYNYSLILLKNL